MSGHEILISHDDYTDTVWPTCGSKACTEALMLTVGIDPKLVAPHDVFEHYVEDTTHVTVRALGESDACNWCYACGDFIQAGLQCEHSEPEGNHRDLGRPSAEVAHSEYVKAIHA